MCRTRCPARWGTLSVSGWGRGTSPVGEHRGCCCSKPGGSARPARASRRSAGPARRCIGPVARRGGEHTGVRRPAARAPDPGRACPPCPATGSVWMMSPYRLRDITHSRAGRGSRGELGENRSRTWNVSVRLGATYRVRRAAPPEARRSRYALICPTTRFGPDCGSKGLRFESARVYHIPRQNRLLRGPVLSF